MDTTQNNALTTKRSVDDWNDEISTRLTPISGLLIMYLVVGVLGNSTVLYMYSFRFKRTTKDRFFIPVLACVDLMTCIIGTSSSFTVNMLPVKFGSGLACKIIHFLRAWFSVASTFLLLAIAVSRYLKICKPFNKQLSLHRKKVILLLIVCLSILLTWPFYLFYGSKMIIDKNTKTIGYYCGNIRDTWYSTAQLVFKSIMFLMFGIILLSLVTLYVLIGKVIFKQRKYRENSKEIPTPTLSFLNDGLSSESKDIPTVVTVNIDNRRHTGRIVVMRPEVRLTLVFMFITMVFVFCYASKLIMLVYQSQNENFWIELGYTEICAYRFWHTFVYVNNIVNPIIYGSWTLTSVRRWWGHFVHMRG